MTNRIPVAKSAHGNFTSWTMTSRTFRDIIIFEASLFLIMDNFILSRVWQPLATTVQLVHPSMLMSDCNLVEFKYAYTVHKKGNL